MKNFSSSIARSITRTVSGVALLAVITNCTPKEKIIEKEVPVAPRKVIEVNNTMDAASLADAGEQLVSPYTFMLAQKAFDMSLEKDANNKKAQFYTAFLKYYMATKGILTRVRPLVISSGDVSGLDKSLKALPNSPLRDFLTQGAEDIQTAGQLQDFFVTLTSALNEFRTFLIDNQNLQLTINLNPYVFQNEITSEYQDTCKVVTEGSYNFTVECDARYAAQRKLNAADMIALRQITSGMMLFHIVYSSYSVEGIEPFFELNKSGQVNREQAAKYIEDNLPDVGKLRKDNRLHQILDFGSDYSAAAKWALQRQSQLCPKGINGEKQRPGYLFSKGFCSSNKDGATTQLALLDAVLAGPIEAKLQNRSGIIQNTKVDYLALFRNPVADLRQLSPSEIYGCSNFSEGRVKLKDATFGGVFPNRDAQSFIEPAGCN